MFQKLARVIIICASVVLVLSRTLSPAHPGKTRSAASPSRGADSVCIVGQLPARRA